MRKLMLFLIFVLSSLRAPCVSAAAPPSDQIIPVFVDTPIEWDPMLAEGTQRENLKLYNSGQIVETTIELPSSPHDQSNARRIMLTCIVEPVVVKQEGKLRPADPWTRLGSVSLLVPANNATSGRSGVQLPGNPPAEVELMRFITGFGGPGTFTQDVTPLAPLLNGKSTIRVSLSSYKKPAWTVNLTFSYSETGVGYRRPVWAKPLFNEANVTAEKNKLEASVDIPAGLARPRLRIISTGHATDGTGGDEFISRTHVLRIDGIEVARWRPWAEEGGALRDKNPMSGRTTIEGRELWSSDIDRSGWHSGEVVDALYLPVPELTPGKHVIELEIVGIRSKDPKDGKGNHGYWRTSAVAVADEPWPEEDKSKQ